MNAKEPFDTLASDTEEFFLFQAAGSPLLLSAGRAPAVAGSTAPSDRIHVACMGLRGRGGSVMHAFAKEPDVQITGAAIYGEDGWVLLTNSGRKALDERDQLVRASAASDATQAHSAQFLDAVRSRRREDLAQEIASGRLPSVLCNAANMAWRTG